MAHKCLATLCAALLFTAAHGAELSVQDWVLKARQDAIAQFDKKFTVTIDDLCVSKITSGNAISTAETGVAVDAVALEAGSGYILEVCSAGALPHYMTALELFGSSAVWKVQTAGGMVEMDRLKECKANGNSCCQIYVIPTVAGTYEVTDEECPALAYNISVTGTPTDTLAPPAPHVSGEEVADDTVPLEVEVNLVVNPLCGLGIPSANEGADGVVEGTGESQAPTTAEGADGVVEGTGESQSPTTAEGADGVVEGTGESQSPPPAESADGIIEGTGESQSPPVPESADGTLEGTGESMSPPPVPESADGTLEGTGESMSPPPVPESADGTLEGTGESQSPPPPTSRRLLQSPALIEGEGTVAAADSVDAIWVWSMGHSNLQTSLVDATAVVPAEGEAAEGNQVEGASVEGEGAAPPTGRRLASHRSLLDDRLMVDAAKSPLTLVVGQYYRIVFNTVREATTLHFEAPEFFAACNVGKIENANALVEFGTFPTSVELAVGNGYFHIYLTPVTPGTYTLSSGESAKTTTINIVATAADLPDPATLATVTVSEVACGVTAPPTGDSTASVPLSSTPEAAGTVTTSSVAHVMTGVCALGAAVAALILL